ncbi:MAG: porin [Rhodanobacter sp.]|uniref:porin n=1 Tax=Rhodanobacter sp. KK11 TaxID=3083255 RepID=UPI002966BBFB|nr:porin [Rhodanobacter sp. KK11]MDW2981829.1 porin [Rhodanobacter sp. KK11]
MRSKLMAAAIVAGLGITSFTAAAAPAQQRTTPAASSAEVEMLKAQLAALQAKVDELEQRTDAQSEINVSTGQAVEKATNVTAASDKKLAALSKAINNTTLSGKMFFDFTSIDDKNSDKGKSDKSGIGLDVKRFYLGVDHKFNDIWSANLTTDFNYASSDGQTSVFVKKAYVQGKFDDAAVFRVGSSDMPWIPFAEKYYGFRYVENTITDRLKYGNSADWGLHLGGDIGASKSLNYAVSVVNGNGYKNPGRSKGVDFEGRVGFVPFENMVVAVGGYSGHRGQETENIAAAHTAERGDFMLAYASKAFRLGAEYFTAKNWNNVLSPLADKADGYSVWGSVAVADNVNLFARYDNAKLSKNLDRDAKDTYYNAGVEYQVTKGFKLAGVWKHGKVDKSVANPVPPHVQNTKTNEIGVFGEVSF